MRTTTLLAVLGAVLVLAVPGHADDHEGTISLQHEATDSQTVFSQIAKLAGRNLIVHPKVDGRITLSLHRVPWRDALEAVAAQVGAVVLEEDGGILRVVPRDDARKNEFTKADEARREEAERAADAARARLEEAGRRLAEARRRLEGQVGGMATEEAIAKTRAEIAELETRQADVRKRLSDLENRMASARARSAEAAARAAAARRRADLVRAKKLAGDGKTDYRPAELSSYAGRRTADGDMLRRAEYLEQAAKNLRAAGMTEEAERAYARARAMRAAARTGRVRLDGGNLVESLNGLRNDVRALREQVAELSGLVRRLLERRGGAGGSVGRGRGGAR